MSTGLESKSASNVRSLGGDRNLVCQPTVVGSNA